MNSFIMQNSVQICFNFKFNAIAWHDTPVTYAIKKHNICNKN